MRLVSMMTVLIPVLALAEPDLDAKVASVLPTGAEERWRSIPWRTNLFAARLEAQQAAKPLLVWVMDGHVLGAT